MAQLVEVLGAESNWVPFLEPRWWTERIHSHKLLPDLHTKPRHTHCPSPHTDKIKMKVKKCLRQIKMEAIIPCEFLFVGFSPCYSLKAGSYMSARLASRPILLPRPPSVGVTDMHRDRGSQSFPYYNYLTSSCVTFMICIKMTSRNEAVVTFLFLSVIFTTMFYFHQDRDFKNTSF